MKNSATRVAFKYLQSSRMKDLLMDMEENDEAWDYLHDSPVDRRVKALNFLRALNASLNLNREQGSAVSTGLDALTYASGSSEPFELIPEKARKMIRYLAYKNERRITSRLPSLPAGVLYKDEIRRLFGN